MRLSPLASATRRAAVRHPRARRGFALLSALMVMVAAAAITALLFVVTVSNQRRSTLQAGGLATQYAAESAIRAMANTVAVLGAKGWLTDADTVAVDTTTPPQITGVSFPVFRAVTTWDAPVMHSWADASDPYRGMRVWTERVTLTAKAVAGNGSSTTMTQKIVFEAIPFAQALYTAFDVAEFETDVPSQSADGYQWTQSLAGLSTTGADSAPAVRANGTIVMSPNTDILTYNGGLFSSGSFILRSMQNTSYPTNPASPYVYHTAGYDNTGSVNVVRDSVWYGATLGAQLYLNSLASGPAAGAGLNTAPLPSQATYPPCQSQVAQGLFGLQCRSTVPASTINLIQNNKDTVDLSLLTPFNVGNGILYMTNKKNNNSTLFITNAASICCAITIVTPMSVVLYPPFNTGVWKPVAVVAPRIYVDHPNLTAETVNATLYGGYWPTYHSFFSLYFGGLMQCLPWALADDWGGDGVPETPLNFNGAIVGFPYVFGLPYQPNGGFVPAATNGPSRYFSFDPRSIPPSGWSPGAPGRYRVTYRPITIVSQ